jgi:catalase
MINAAGERVFVKYHFKTQQGIKTLAPAAARALAGTDPDHAQRDLFEAIERKEHPRWTMAIQVMPEADAAAYRINPFDVTKVWPHKDYPRIDIAELVLDRNPLNYFADVEQAAFAPSSIVPGLGFSPDRMLQGRLFAYADAQRYRLGVNHHQIPVNQPHNAVHTYHRDGGVRVDGNAGAAPSYHPNSSDGVRELAGGAPPPYTATGPVQRYDHRSDADYYSQAGDLYRLMTAEQRSLLVSNLVHAMRAVPREIQARQIAHFHKADADYGARVEHGLADVPPAAAGDPRQVSVAR